MKGTGIRRRPLALALLPLALAASGAAGKVHLQGKGGTLSHDCAQDAAVEIDGTGSEIRLTGACERIDISGTNLTVRAEGVGRVEISGLNNTLEWRYATGGRTRPSVEQNGIGHRVVKVEAKAAESPAPSAAKPAAPAPRVEARSAGSSATVDTGGVTARSGANTARVDAAGVTASTGAATSAAAGRASASVALEAETSTAGVESGKGGFRITANGVHRRVDCGGAKVQILGDDVVALLLGDCPNVQVAGDRCEVWIERVDQLQILGAESRAFYVGSTDGDRVKVSLVGAGSTARAVSRDELAERRRR